jgi:O-antigen ligase
MWQDARMRDRLPTLEALFLALFPLVFCLLILPVPGVASIFFIPKLVALGVFCVLTLLLRVTGPRGTGGAPPRTVWLALSLFAASITVSTLVSVDRNESWLGTPEFWTGSLFMLLGALTFAVYASGERVRRGGLAALILIFNALVIAEYLGFRPLTFITEAHTKLNTVYPAVTVSYRGQVAGVCLLLALLPLSWFRERYTDWRFWLLFIVGVTGLGCTTNSSATLGFLVAMLLFMALSWTNPGQKNLVCSLLIPVIALAGMNAYRPLMTLSQSLYATGAAPAQADAKDLRDTKTLSIRLRLWEAGLHLFAARPLLGWGPQTYNHHWFDYLSDEKVKETFRMELGLPQVLTRQGSTVQYTGPDGKSASAALNYVAPHNAFIDLLYSQGLTGLLSFAFLLLAVARFVTGRLGRAGALALLPVAGYLIYLLGWFITLPSTGLAAMLLGMVVAEARATSRLPR